MQPLLFDEGLPRVGPALSALGLAVHEVGGVGAPPKGGSDEDNCKWCKANSAILVTHDRGKTDKMILDALAVHHVHAIFVHKDLRSAPAHHLARALLSSESKMDQLVARRGLLRHRLQPSGRLETR